MLILTRRLGETVMLGDDIIITVIGIVGNQIRLGIKAPRDIEVHREEIYERIQDEKRIIASGEKLPDPPATARGVISRRSRSY